MAEIMTYALEGYSTQLTEDCDQCLAIQQAGHDHRRDSKPMVFGHKGVK